MTKIAIQISNDINIETENLPQEILTMIITDLTMDNPAFKNAVRLGKYTGCTAEFISLYRYQRDRLFLPRGYIRQLIDLLRNMGQEYHIDNQTLILPPVDFHSRIKPRIYQEAAIKALVGSVQGGIIGGCGSGKTQILLEGMAQIRQPALWITHTKELMNQLIDRASQCFDISREEIGIIAEGRVSTGDRLTVALVQTLSRIDISRIAKKFGAVFVDEGHHIAADSFYRATGQFPARYRFWCTATPEREDGLGKMVLATGGPILHVINSNDLPTITPQLVIVETDYEGYVDAENYPGMVSDLVNNIGRNRLIVDTIANNAPCHYSLVLSDRVDHLAILKKMLIGRLPDLSIEILTGNTPKKKRLEVIGRARNKQVGILLATQLAREGLDLPHLDRLFLATPKKAAAATEQEIGRIRRSCDNKCDAIVFDFWDTQHPIFKAQFWRRKVVYEKLGIAVDFKKGIQRIRRKVI